MNAIRIATAVCFAVLVGVVFFQKREIADLNSDNGSLASQLATEKASNENLKTQREEDQSKYDALAEKMRAAEMERDDARASLNSLRDHIQEDAIADPHGVAQRATDAAGRMFDDIWRATGGEGGEDQAVPAGRSGASDAGSP